MIVAIMMLALSLCIILASCTIFVNAIEWLGKKLDLHQGIIGSIFTAIGTAMPETVIPIIALLFTKSNSARAIGIGAMWSAVHARHPLGFFVTGAAVIVNTMLNGAPCGNVRRPRRAVARFAFLFLLLRRSDHSRPLPFAVHPTKLLVALGLPLPISCTSSSPLPGVDLRSNGLKNSMSAGS